MSKQQYEHILNFPQSEQQKGYSKLSLGGRLGSFQNADYKNSKAAKKPLLKLEDLGIEPDSTE